MAHSHTDTGNYGEALAAAHLRRKGYSILEMNWRCPRGELDIVARQAETLVFVEVKTRRLGDLESAFLSVTPLKRERLVASAYTYMHQHELDDCLWRVDVIAIALPRTGKPLIDHRENALDW